MAIYYIKNSFQNIISSNLYFINLHYLERYIKIVSKFKERNLLKKENPGYHKHHIIPRCLNGSNKEMNLVVLSPREHFIIHHLLWKAFPQTGLTFSFKSMVHGFKHYHGNRISSKVYEKLCLDNSCFQKGNKHSEETRKKISEGKKGKKHSDEARKNMSEGQKGKRCSDEHRMNISNSLKGKKHSEESKLKMSESRKEMKGKKHSEESKLKMSEANKGRKFSEESIRKRTESRKNLPKKIWVCNSSCSRMIQKELLEEYLSNGFILGRKFNKE